MKKIFTILVLTAMSLTASAEDVVMALVLPRAEAGKYKVEPMEINMTRGELRNAFTWQAGFRVVTRTDVDAILNEHGFQQSGMVADNQRIKIGEMTGAQYICVSTITKYASQLYIEAYLVNVQTGEMTNAASQYVNIKNEDYSTLPTACENLASAMLGEISGSSHRRPSSNRDFTESAWGINMKMIWVEGGDFLMGCTSEQGGCESDEQNVRRVTVDGFYIGMLEVTQSQWEKVMGTSIYQQRNKTDPSWSIRGAGPDYPMYFVSWEEATEFCRLLSNKTGRTYTLPTEAQWEYAARGGKKADGTKYAGSNMIDAVAWYMDNSGSSTHPCGTKRANALGIYDMSGNVYEWCKDWYSNSYMSSDTNNPTGPSSGSDRVIRGGSWGNSATYCRVANRNYDSPGGRGYYLGFRVVLLP